MSDGDRAIADVIALELRLLDPLVRARSEEVERLLHADFREFGASGRTWDRASMVHALASDPGGPTEVSDMSAGVVAADVVLVTYVAVAGGGGDDRPKSLRSSLWRKGDNGWRVLFHQGTPVASGPDGW